MSIRESYATKDGCGYPLWIDVNDVIKTIIPTYLFAQREDRRKINMMFRGHTDAEWDLVPTLFRPPVNEKIIKQRRQYTENFMNALTKNAHNLNLRNLSEPKLLAIAQHYGFYTHLLDFSRNLEVAAYFATYTEHPPRIGASFAYPIDEYNKLRNPLAALCTSLEESEELLGDLGLAPILDENFDDVPRIYHQEGLFIECPVNKAKAVQNNCIDRYYFYQRIGIIYQGQFAFATGLPSSRRFARKDAYTSFINIARREHPELFQQTSDFGTVDLFPPVDPLSVFAMEWKKAHPDPIVSAYAWRNPFRFLSNLFGKTPDTASSRASVAAATTTTAFAAAVDNFYFDRERRTPYQTSVIQPGRELIESLRKYKELDNLDNQRWLLWKLLRSVTEGGKYTCTIKLNGRTPTGKGDQAFHVMIIDRWLEATYLKDIPIAQAQQGFWQVRFDKPHYGRWDDKPELSAAPQLFSLQKQYQPVKGNPYHANADIKRILASINKRLRNFAEGENGSFVYDLQCILMRGFGRDLRVVLGIGDSDRCCFFSPMVATECAEGKSQLIVEIYDGFFQALKRTSVCSKHSKHFLAGDINLFNSTIEFPLGLA